MRRILLGFLCATALSSAAFAADLPIRKAAPIERTYAPAFSWTGFYLGVNLGYGWGKANGTTTISGNTFGANGVYPGSTKLDGINGGGQAGYNWQTGAFVFGIEGDYQVADQKRTTVIGCGIGCTVTDISKISSFATVRGRLGYAVWDRGLLYVTGGWAYLNAKENVNAAAGGVTVNLLNLSTGRSGWTIGGGYEWMFVPNWSTKIEYLYMQASGANAVAGIPAVLGGGTITENGTLRNNVVRAGINYHF